MEVDRLFIETLDDLRGRAVWGASEYALLRAAALLRELVLDDRPLVLAVNRARQHQLTYRVREPPPNPRLLAWLGIDPAETAEGGAVQDLRIKELLAFPMFFLDRSTLTVKDLILLGANVLGGVHLGPAKTASHQAHEIYPLKIKHGSTPLELVALVPITAVLLRGLEPLREAVFRDLPTVPEYGGRVAVTMLPGRRESVTGSESEERPTRK
jgi:hypothetical protein